MRREPVTDARHRYYEFMVILSFAEDPSQQENVLSEISFFDETVWPDR